MAASHGPLPAVCRELRIRRRDRFGSHALVKAAGREALAGGSTISVPIEPKGPTAEKALDPWTGRQQRASIEVEQAEKAAPGGAVLIAVGHGAAAVVVVTAVDRVAAAGRRPVLGREALLPGAQALLRYPATLLAREPPRLAPGRFHLPAGHLRARLLRRGLRARRGRERCRRTDV